MRNTIHIILLFIFTLSACTLDPNDQFIQGTWESANPEAGVEYFQWRFSNGTFRREQEIDRANTLYTTGSYRVIESGGEVIILELFDYSGDRISYENNPMTLKIEIDRANDTSRITNIVFVRGGPK